jgi:hypothetical protein
VLYTAVLGALAEKDSGAVRINPHPVGMVGNQIGLPREFRDPEAVVSVGGKQVQECRGRTLRIAHWDVQLIRGNDPQHWIAKLPPVLVSDRGDFHGARRLGRPEWRGSLAP